MADSLKSTALPALERGILLETESSSPRDSILGDAHQSLGIYYYTKRNYNASLNAFYKSTEYFEAAKQYELAKTAFGVYRRVYQYLVDDNYELVDSVKRTSESWHYQLSFFTIDSILSVDGDTALIMFPAGTNQMVFLGSYGGVLSGSLEGMEYRENQVLGNLEVVEIFPNYAIAKFVYSPGMKDKGLYVGDLAATNVKSSNPGLSDLSQLAIKGIHLKDANGIPYNSTFDFNALESELIEKIILRSMTEEIKSWGEYIAGLGKYDTTMVEGGKFDGMNWPDALSNTSTIDVKAFLNYVRTYPFGYMGQEYKFSETYFTWLIGSTTIADKEAFQKFFIEDLKSLEDDSIAVVKERFTFNYYLNKAFESPYEMYSYLYNEHYRKKSDNSKAITNKYNWLTKGIEGLDTFSAYATYLKAYYCLEIEDYKGSEHLFTELYNSGILKLDALWGRANGYFEQDLYMKSIEDYDLIIAQDTQGYYKNMSYGNKGAAWFRLADWRKAKALFTQAYALDSTSSIWALNMGISHITEGNDDSAKYYINKGLKQAASKAEYTTFQGAFDFLIEKGWFVEPSKKYKVYIKGIWEENYEMDVLALENYTKAKDAYDLEAYEKSIPYFDTAIIYEQHRKQIDYVSLRSYYRYKAYAYYILKNYDSSLLAYKNGLEINLKHLNDKEKLVDDYDAIGNIYSWKDDWVNKAVFDEMEYAVSYTLKMDTFKPRLFVLGISTTDPGGPFKYAANDVEDLYKALNDSSNTAFSSITFNHLQNAGSKAVQFTFLDLSSILSEDDVLLLHIAGPTYQDGNERGFLLGKNDSLSIKKLFTNMSYLRTKNIIAIADAPNMKFADDYVVYRNKFNVENENMNAAVLSPGAVRVEDDKRKHSVFIEHIIQSLKDSSYVNSQMLDFRLMKDYTLGGPRLAISSYHSGRPIVMMSANANSVKQIPKDQGSNRGQSEQSTTRGAITYDLDEAGSSEGKDYALLFATNEYDSWGDLINPINDAVALKKVLEENYGFKVELVTNATQRDVMRKLTEYKNKSFGNKDQLLIYFAGHGYYDEKEGDAYLVCKNSVWSDEEKQDGFPTYIHYTYLNGAIGHMSSCKNVFMIMDVCFGGTFFDKATPAATYAGVSNDNRDMIIRNKREIQTRVFLTSGSKEYVPDGKPGANSPFSAKLLQALNERASVNGIPKPYMTMEDVVSYMHGLPTKVKYGTFGIHQQNGDFIFEYKGFDVLRNLQQEND